MHMTLSRSNKGITALGGVLTQYYDLEPFWKPLKGRDDIFRASTPQRPL
jgi:hypothetical protein